jgi:hypothetical protein
MAIFFNDVEVLWIARFDYKSNWILSSHAHEDFYQLIYCLEGDCTLLLADGRQSVRSPLILFFPPGTRHGIGDISARGLKTLDTKFIVRSSELAALCENLPRVIPPTTNEIHNLLDDIRESGCREAPLFQEYCQALLGQILIRLVRISEGRKGDEQSSDRSPKKEALSPLTGRIVAYVERHYQEGITAEILEDHLHYSYRYLSKLSLRELGMTPAEYIDRYKGDL